MRNFLDLDRCRGITAAAALICAVWLLTAALRYSEGPPPAHTGGFGEPTCHTCHFDQPLNDPAGSVELIGLPATYEPGRSYPITVAVSHPALRRAGFQLSARFSEGDRAGRQAGVLIAGDANTAVSRAGIPEVHFAHHTASGSVSRAPGSSQWRLDWRAPAGQKSVVFHIAGNAANDDASELGDHVYADSIIIRARPGADR